MFLIRLAMQVLPQIINFRTFRLRTVFLQYEHYKLELRLIRNLLPIPKMLLCPWKDYSTRPAFAFWGRQIQIPSSSSGF